MFHRETDIEAVTVNRIVLPKNRRQSVLRLAHDDTGHLSAKKVRRILHPRFTWPGVIRDVIEYCRSCPVCQKVNKQGNRQTVMQRRPVITEPFDCCAIDLVGPLPKAKGGARFLLTFVCMASRWPEAIPLKTITAKAVAEGLMQFFARTGLPLTLLSDQAKQFTGRLMRELADTFNIQLIKTTPYHPQSNGVLERLHGTLEAILTKATKKGHDWEKFLPLAMFSLRQCPNRDTGFSPFHLIYGKNVRTPLDMMCAGWAERTVPEADVCEWIYGLQERLRILQDSMMEKGLLETERRKGYYDKTKTERMFKVGDKILCRIPGLASKLEDSWEGPYSVVDRVGEVNYKGKR